MSRMRVESRRRIRGDRGSRTGAALVRLTAALALAGVAGGCGGDSDDAPALPADPGRALAQSAAALRAEGTFTFEASFTRVKVTTPDDVEEYATAHGALDLTADEGTAELELAPLFPGQEESPLDGPVELRWTATSLNVVLGGRAQTIERARSRASSGLIGRYPDEVEALVDLLAKPLRPRLLEREDGTAHYAFSYDAKAAGRRGIPAELNEAFEQALYGPRLELEAWIEDDGLPHRISYAIHLKPLRGSFNFSLPRRTVRVSYELDDFGDEYDPNG
jgi:hypothetical protein